MNKIIPIYIGLRIRICATSDIMCVGCYTFLRNKIIITCSHHPYHHAASQRLQFSANTSPGNITKFPLQYFNYLSISITMDLSISPITSTLTVSRKWSFCSRYSKSGFVMIMRSVSNLLLTFYMKLNFVMLHDMLVDHK